MSITRSGAAAPAKSRRRLQPWEWAPYVFISPFFILFLCFGLFPLLFSVWLSFHTWDAATGLGGMHWVGIENYTFVLGDEWFQKSLYNTFWLALASGLPQHLVAIPLAFFAHTYLAKWRNTVVGIYFLPFITSSVAIALVFNSLFSRDFGVVNLALTTIGNFDVAGVHPFAWLFPTTNIDWGQPQYTKSMIAFLVFWRYVGWNTVLYLSALQTIPHDLYEAATIDGASRRQQFWYITLPLLKPMMFFAVTLTIIGNLQLFEEPFIITGGTGGLDQAGKTAAMHMYNTAFVDSDFGTASAVAWILFVLIAVLTTVNNKLFAHKD
ncbi:carbohydrate ABC transporter permease [Niveibacterium umoris]|uniref:Multiple sugar transport system permease protein n=1 Tax=Niveibacterium umoris TaxID=1193620 RepID=A0A840BPT3_9RHOO|nr:sugar ABC transporter permease [Niveibacterium umoris]MBB4012856.1 multiple sugar transport system permease protein [Niveibacterium umoris]